MLRKREEIELFMREKRQCIGLSITENNTDKSIHIASPVHHLFYHMVCEKCTTKSSLGSLFLLMIRVVMMIGNVVHNVSHLPT